MMMKGGTTMTTTRCEFTCPVCKGHDLLFAEETISRVDLGHPDYLIKSLDCRGVEFYATETTDGKWVCGDWYWTRDLDELVVNRVITEVEDDGMG